MINRSKKKRMGNRRIEKRIRDCEDKGMEGKQNDERTQWEWYQIHWFPFWFSQSMKVIINTDKATMKTGIVNSNTNGKLAIWIIYQFDYSTLP